jgi:hypothetical protein
MKKLFCLTVLGGLLLIEQTVSWAANELPVKLDLFVLGEQIPLGSVLPSVPTSNIYDGNPYQHRDLSTENAKKILREILPKYKSDKVSARVGIYRGKLAYIAIELGDKTFAETHRRLVKNFGSGLQKTTLVSAVLDGCDTYYFQQWPSQNSAQLFLIGDNSKGVDIHLRDRNIHSLVEQDDQVHIEYEQCIDF